MRWERGGGRGRSKHEEKVQRLLLNEINPSSAILLNYFPVGWSECDVCEITEDGIFFEYEIKMDSSGLGTEMMKTIKSWCTRGKTVGKKHGFLKRGSRRGPAKFWFVCPESIRSVPFWCGLMHVKSGGLKVIKEAPLLYRGKSRSDLVKRAFQRYHEVARYVILRRGIDKMPRIMY